MKIKAFLFFILSSFSFFCGAQNLKAFLYTATFNSPSNKPYIETYLSFDANSIKLKFSERNGYFGELDILIEVIKESTIVYSDHYKLKSPFFVDSVSNNRFCADFFLLNVAILLIPLEVIVTKCTFLGLYNFWND